MTVVHATLPRSRRQSDAKLELEAVRMTGELRPVGLVLSTYLDTLRGASGRHDVGKARRAARTTGLAAGYHSRAA